MALTCTHCNTAMHPVHSRKPDGFLQTKYNCECGKAELAPEPLCIYDLRPLSTDTDSGYSEYKAIDLGQSSKPLTTDPTAEVKFVRTKGPWTITLPPSMAVKPENGEKIE